MNLLSLLGLGQAPNAMAMQQAQQTANPATPGPVPQGMDEEGIVVEADQRPRSRFRDGIVQKGTFSMGRTGGNILGLLGDALLINGGADPIYQKRLKQARGAEAMASYTDNPEEAVAMMNEIDYDEAADRWDKHLKTSADVAGAEADAAADRDKYEGNTHERALSLISSATGSTYDSLRKMYYDTYERRGVQPIRDLPERYDATELEAVKRAGIPVGDQAKNDALTSYRNATISQRDRSVQAAMERARIAAESAYDRTELVQDRTDGRTAVQEEGRNTRAQMREDTGPRRPSGIQIYKDPKTGKVRVIRK